MTGLRLAVAALLRRFAAGLDPSEPSPAPALPRRERQLTTEERAVWLLAIRRARHTPAESDVVHGPQTAAVRAAFAEERLRDALHRACRPFTDRRRDPAQA